MITTIDSSNATISSTEFRVYVACLASYNAGELHGAWIDIDSSTDIDDINAAIAEMLAGSPTAGAEEYAVHDYDGIPSSFGEWPDFSDIIAYVAACETHGTDVFSAAMALSDSVSEAIKLCDVYYGEFDNEGDYAAQYLEDCYSDMPDVVKNYMDYERLERDMELEGSIQRVRSGCKILVFGQPD